MTLHGLVLAGGQSRRMGQDKAALTLGGRSLLARAMTLVEGVCDEAFVSVRESVQEGERGRYRQIADAHGGVGPADGIASAFVHSPASAWLVVACDLPRLSADVLATLIAGRDANADATAYANDDGLPEPLCAIYEPSSRAQIATFVANDMRCPRKMLLSMNTTLLAPAADDALANANTPEQWRSIAGASN
ncbi:MAG: molybdenum cofactor guanylyltransferase [Gammaproteobacteria bacterium]